MIPGVLPTMVALATLVGCDDKDGDLDVVEQSAEASPAVSTVFTVRWSTSAESTGYVRFRTDERVFNTQVTPAGTEHEAVLLGLPPDTDFEWQVVVQKDGQDVTTGPLESARTGSLPSLLPGTAVSGEGHGQYLLTPLIGATTGPVIFDPQGRVVWYHIDERGLDVYRARLALDGSGVIYNAASISGDPAADSVLVKVTWDGTQETIIPVPLLAHDFVQLADGTITAIVVKYGDGPDGQIRGDSLVEVAPDGSLEEVWTSWDCFDPATQPGDEPELGWTWVNALDYAEDADAYDFSIHNFSSIARVPRGSRSCEWVLGLEGATIDIEGSRFVHQHQFELEGNRLVVFDNEGAGATQSRAIEYDVDFEAQVATEVWRYQPDPSIYSFVLGDVHRYPDGDTLVTWSVAGQIDRVSSDGVPEWSLNTDLGYAFGFMTLSNDLYENMR